MENFPDGRTKMSEATNPNPVGPKEVPASQRSLQLKIPREAMVDLGTVARYSDKLGAVHQAIGKVTNKTSLHNLISEVSDSVETNPVIVQRILNALSSLQQLSANLKVDAETLVEALTTNLEAQASKTWKDEYLNLWKPAKASIIAWLKQAGPDDPLALARKTNQLIFDHQNVFRSCSLITDLRPVFNAAGDKVENVIILHKLIIGYTDSGSEPEHRIEFALDARDLADLRRGCDRAELKVATLKASLKDMPFGVTIPREKSMEGGPQ
jgi:hypothetical protein